MKGQGAKGLLRWKAILLCCSFFIFFCKTPKEHKQESAVLKNAEQTELQAETDTPQGSIEKLIVGEWQWDKTICCGRTPSTQTSESLKAPKVLRFNPDGTVQYFSGEEETSTQTYKITYAMRDYNRPVITLGDSPRAGLLFIRGDTLVIDYGYMDLQQEFYLRKK